MRLVRRANITRRVVRRRRRVVGRHIRNTRRRRREHRVPATHHDVRDTSVLEGDLDGLAVTVDSLLGSDAVLAVAHSGVVTVRGGFRLLEGHALSTQHALELVVERDALLGETSVLDQLVPLVRILVEAERVGPDRENLGILARLLDEEIALSVGQVVRVSRGLCVASREVTDDSVVLVVAHRLDVLVLAGAIDVRRRLLLVLGVGRVAVAGQQGVSHCNQHDERKGDDETSLLLLTCGHDDPPLPTWGRSFVETFPTTALFPCGWEQHVDAS